MTTQFAGKVSGLVDPSDVTDAPAIRGGDTKIVNVLPMFGYPGPLFIGIHATALVSLSTSVLVTIGVMVYMFTKSPLWNFFQQPIGERLVIYLALCDLLNGISHTIDHAYILAAEDYAPEAVCKIFAFFLQVRTKTLVFYFSVNLFINLFNYYLIYFRSFMVFILIIYLLNMFLFIYLF